MIIDLKGVMTEGVLAWESEYREIHREFSILELYICQSHLATISVRGNMLFLSWELGRTGDVMTLAEQWGSQRGFSAIEAECVETYLRARQPKYHAGCWRARCLCTAETAVWNNTVTDILQDNGLWFDPPTMPLIPVAPWQST
jgi:hypothetical protein